MLYIIDTDEEINYKTSKLTDDTKIINKATSTSQWKEPQCDVNNLLNWTENDK